MKFLLGAAAMGLTLSAAMPLAIASDGNDPRCGNVDRAQWLSLAEVATRVGAMGYDVRKVEADDGCWEVKGRGQDGRWVELYLNPQTAEIVKRDYDDDGDD